MTDIQTFIDRKKDRKRPIYYRQTQREKNTDIQKERKNILLYRQKEKKIQTKRKVRITTERKIEGKDRYIKRMIYMQTERNKERD